MIIAVIVLILFVIGILYLQTVKCFSLKNTGFLLIILAFAATLTICIASPAMHKQFSFNIIDYLIKFNDDGTMSTTKQTTQTILQQQDETNK